MKPLPRIAAFARARRDLLARVGLAVAQIAALLWFAIPKGFPLDDAWIHQVVARTFAESGTLGYAPGEHGAAATSYFWAALLALNFKTLHVSPVKWAFALSAIASVATGQLLLSLLERKSEGAAASEHGRGVAFAATLLACTGGNVLWFAHSGMEASLFVGLSMTAVWAVTAPNASVRLTALGGVAAGLAALTRPDGAPLCAIVLGYVLVRRRGTARIAAALVPALLAGAVYVGSNLAKTGHATPTTLSGRRWLWFEPVAGLSGWDRAADFASAWVERLSTYTFDSGPLGAWLFIALAGCGATRVLRTKNDGIRVLFGFAVVHTLGFVFLLTTPGHGGRYQPFVPLLYVACVALGTASIVRTVVGPRRADRPWFAVVVVPWFVFSLTTTTTLRHAHELAVAHIEATEIETGKFVDGLPREAVVASFDIGGIGWATRRPILDAGGLSDPKTAALLERGRIWEYFQKHGVRYVVLPEGLERVLPAIDYFVSRLHLDNPAIRLTRVHEAETAFEHWLPGIAATWNASPKQVVYSVEYTGAAAPADIAPVANGARRPIRDDASLVRLRERLLTEHALAVLEAWGFPASVSVTPAASKAALAGDQTCAIDVGMWGVDVAGCDDLVDRRVLRSMLYEHLGRYLDIGDLGGALRALPHALTMARRAREPRFHPPISPIMMPGGNPPDRTLAWGIPLALATVLLVTLLDLGMARRLRRKDEGARASAKAVAPLAALVVLVGAASLACSGCSDASLVRAVSQGRGSVDLALADHASLEEVDGAGRTPLLVAAARGDVDIVSLLLARGARVDAHDHDDATALHHAARGGHHACVLVLVRAGAPVDALAGLRRRTALHDAALAASLETVRVLLAAGSDPGIGDSFGETALHLLARADRSRSAGIAPLLLAASAEPGARRDARGFTAAHAAAVTEQLTLLRELAASSLITTPTPGGEAPVDTAMRYGRELAADLLLRNGARLRDPAAWPPLHDAARTDAATRVAELLSAGADPTAEHDGKTALDVAREHGSLRALTLLTQKASPRP